MCRFVPVRKVLSILCGVLVATSSFLVTGQAQPVTTSATEYASAAVYSDIMAMARRSSQLTGADLLKTRTGATGQGVVVAVVDTGVDISHLDITAEDNRLRRIKDWIDVSGEGDVKTTSQINLLTSRFAHTPVGYADLREVNSKSGRVFYGILSEQQLDVGGRIQQDLDRNGRSDDRFLVVVADSQVAGRYDTVYVDVDRNLRLTGDEALGEFRITGRVGWFGSSGTNRPATSFVISRVSADGRSVSIGFDGNGHGTHMAGVIAASGGSSGGITGIAPGVRLVVVKALGSSGRGSWDQVKSGIEQAAALGADIISVSITALARGGLDSEFLRRLSVQHGTVIVLAAGNNGPGLGSVSMHTHHDSTLVVGAYMPSQLWKDVYGYNVPGGSLWYFSAVGPNPDNGHGIDVVAPAAALSTVPSWEGRNVYDVLEGSSVAVPHVSAAAALLIETARRQGRMVSPFLITNAIRSGAVSLSGYAAVEQGAGALDVNRSYEWLMTVGYHLPVRHEIQWSVDGARHGQQGVYGRGDITTNMTMQIRSPWNQQRLTFYSSALWLKADRQQLNLSAATTRRLTILTNPPREPGLYVGSLSGMAPSHSGVRLDATMVVPHHIDGNWRRFTGVLDPARYRREFLSVPESTRSISLRLTVPVSGIAQGRLRMHVFNPDGNEVYFSDFVGAPETNNVTIVHTVKYPEAGVWEVIIYSSAALSDYGLTRSEYRFEAKVDHTVITVPDHGVIVGHPPIGPWTHSFKIENRGASVMLEPAFVTAPGMSPIASSEKPLLHRNGSVTRILPDIAGEVALLQVRVSNPDDGVTDLDLYLYWQDPTTRTYHEVGSSAVMNRTTETVEIRQPRSGRYVVYVDAPTQYSDTVSFDLIATVVPASDIVIVPQTTRVLSDGQAWTLQIRGDVAPPRGDHAYVIGFRDILEGTVVAQLPLRIDTRNEQLIVSMFPAVLTRATTTVTLTVSERSTNRPVDNLIVMVNDRNYLVRQGKATVPVGPGSDNVKLRIVVDDPRYRFWSGQVELVRGQDSRVLHHDLPELDPYFSLRVRHFL